MKLRFFEDNPPRQRHKYRRSIWNDITIIHLNAFNFENSWKISLSKYVEDGLYKQADPTVPGLKFTRNIRC